MTGLSILALFFGFITGIFWMVVGWRAMIAHEKVANSLEFMARESARVNKANDNTGSDTTKI